MYYMVISIIGVIILAFMVKRNYINKIFIVIWNLGIIAIYLIWRITVIPFSNLFESILGILLFISETIVITEFIISQILFVNDYKVKKKFLSDFKENIPSVAVFICTYNEPEDLVETTILAALNLEYSAEKLKIYLCDDGHRESMRQLANRCKIEYITRGSNEGAKAGNLNNALLSTESDLFVVLDSDMICSKEFLNKTVGYFCDAQVAFVQTPQVYYNKDMYQRNLKKDIPNEQDFFMREVQRARASVNAVLHVGTNAVFRRKSVMEVGMYPTNSITEDMAMGMLLQSNGYKTIFINEVLVLGLTASTYTDLVIQRDRWCRGNLQTTKSFNPLTKKGLNIFQRLAYFNGMIYWYTYFSKIIFTLCPLIFLLTTVQSVQAELYKTIVCFIPFFISQIFTFNSLISNSRSLKWAHYYDIAMAPHMCLSVLKEFFFSDVKFIVTPKDMRNDKSYFQTEVIIPHLILAAISLVAWIVGLFYLNANIISIVPFSINLAWSIYNFIGIAVCVRVAYHIADIEHSNAADIKNGYLIIVHKDKQYYAALINSLLKDGLEIKVDTKLSAGEGEIILRYRTERIKFKGTIEANDEINKFYYKKLNIEQKKAIVEIYVENLQPSFNVEVKMDYIL